MINIFIYTCLTMIPYETVLASANVVFQVIEARSSIYTWITCTWSAT